MADRAPLSVTQQDPVNILLVDDQPAKLLTYESILGELGENLIKVSSATEALDCLLRHDVAVVLVDVVMPELDGYELAAMIRQHPRFQQTSIIFVSALMLTDLDRLRGYECGAVDYVPVPVVPEILRAKVSVFADLYRKTRALERLNAELEQRRGRSHRSARSHHRCVAGGRSEERRVPRDSSPTSCAIRWRRFAPPCSCCASATSPKRRTSGRAK
jgi:CheY-like chemotaxis protein